MRKTKVNSDITTAEKIKAIRKVKSLLAEVVVAEVASELGWHRSNIYFHLDETRAPKVSIPHLRKISDAIEAVKIKRQNDQRKQLSQII